MNRYTFYKCEMTGLYYRHNTDTDALEYLEDSAMVWRESCISDRESLTEIFTEVTAGDILEGVA